MEGRGRGFSAQCAHSFEPCLRSSGLGRSLPACLRLTAPCQSWQWLFRVCHVLLHTDLSSMLSSSPHRSTPMDMRVQTIEGHGGFMMHCQQWDALIVILFVHTINAAFSA